MKKKLLVTVLALTLIFSTTACNKNTAENTENKAQTSEQAQANTTETEKGKDKKEKHDFSDKLQGEDGKVRWVRGHSGNLMMTMARQNGYLEEYGLEVEEIPMQTTKESFAAVAGDQVDVVSNAGTNEPLQRVASGDDIRIFGGHMVEGAMFIIGPKDAEWTGLESLIGKKLAGNPSNYVVSGPLLEKGYDPIKDINWVQIDKGADGISAVKSGQVDYSVVGTEIAYQAKTDPSIKVCAKFGDLMDKYSCCRMETASRFIDGKPNTTKALLKALLRGMKDYHDNPEAASKLLAEELDVPLEFVEAYTLDSGYEIHPDPLYNSCVRAWGYLDELGFLDENAKNIDLRDHIDVDLYKEALDEVIEEVGDEDPEYWQEQVDYFNKYNSMYYDKNAQEEYVKNFKQTIKENREKNQSKKTS